MFHFLRPTVFILFPVLFNGFSIFVHFAPPLHFFHLGSLILKPNLDNANWKTRVFRESLSNLSARLWTNLKGGLKPTTFQKEQATGFMTPYVKYWKWNLVSQSFWNIVALNCLLWAAVKMVLGLLGPLLPSLGLPPPRSSYPISSFMPTQSYGTTEIGSG